VTKKFSDEMLDAVSQNSENTRFVRDLASYALNLRRRFRDADNADTNILERQIRDLTAENKSLKRRITELESTGVA